MKTKFERQLALVHAELNCLAILNGSDHAIQGVRDAQLARVHQQMDALKEMVEGKGE